MKKDKRKTYEKYDSYYETHGQRGDPCVYCGDASEALDHVPPLRSCEFLDQTDLEWTVLRKYPSCHECNGALNASTLFCIESRKTYLKSYYLKKYKNLLKTPEWSEEELEELSEELASDIRNTLTKKLSIELKLRVLR